MFSSKLIFTILACQNRDLGYDNQVRAIGVLLVSVLGLAAMTYYEQISNVRGEDNGDNKDICFDDFCPRKIVAKKSLVKRTNREVGPFYPKYYKF